MLKKHSTSYKSVLINATNIGYRLNGIGVYTLSIIKELTKFSVDINFIIYLNESCKDHIKNIYFPKNFDVRWVGEWVSPDKKFIGHLLRLFYSNYLSLKHPKHLQFNTSPLEISLFKSNQVVTVHDIIPILFKKFHKKQYLFYKVILKYVLRNINLIITPSVHTKRLLLDQYKLSEKKIQVVPHGVHEVLVKKSKAAGISSPYILYIGRINKMKNIDGIVKSFIIASRYTEIDLVIIGDNKKGLFKLLDNLNCNHEVRNRIIFLENVSENEKFGLIKAASIFVYPTHYEGFGLPPLEAMLCGCPIIVSNNSTLPEVCGNAAYYVSPKNESEIANGIIEVLRNDQLRRQLIKNGLERAQIFSWGKAALAHLKIIERILEHSSSSAEYESMELKPLVQEKVILNRFWL